MRAAADPTARVAFARSAEWHEHRAQALAMPRSSLVGTCGKRWRTVQCGCGETEVPVGCDQTQLCEACRKEHWRRWRKRIVRSFDAHLRGARDAWGRSGAHGRRPGIYLITFTMPHSGDIATDRRTMGVAWRALTKAANAGGWWGTYALAWEVTPGTSGDGHVHMHVAVISSWVPYRELRDAWERVMPGATKRSSVDVQAPSRKHRSDSESAADYLAKYVTKGVEPAVFTGQKAAELLVAFRGLRKVTTSLHFWRPMRDREGRCPHCGERNRALGAPSGLASIAPGVQLYPRGWWAVGRRRDEQCILLADTG